MPSVREVGSPQPAHEGPSRLARHSLQKRGTSVSSSSTVCIGEPVSDALELSGAKANGGSRTGRTQSTGLVPRQTRHRCTRRARHAVRGEQRQHDECRSFQGTSMYL